MDTIHHQERKRKKEGERVGGKNPLSTTLGFWEATEL